MRRRPIPPTERQARATAGARAALRGTTAAAAILALGACGGPAAPSTRAAEAARSWVAAATGAWGSSTWVFRPAIDPTFHVVGLVGADPYGSALANAAQLDFYGTGNGLLIVCHRVPAWIDPLRMGMGARQEWASAGARAYRSQNPHEALVVLSSGDWVIEQSHGHAAIDDAPRIAAAGPPPLLDAPPGALAAVKPAPFELPDWIRGKGAVTSTALVLYPMRPDRRTPTVLRIDDADPGTARLQQEDVRGALADPYGRSTGSLLFDDLVQHATDARTYTYGASLFVEQRRG